MITISLCMIVRDEEAVLARCLESVREVADEIVIVDTGSVDGTRKIARKYTDRVYELPWQDDFSQARNYAFSQANMEYCMWLDADDLVPEESRRKLLELKESLSPSVDMVMLPYETAFDEAGRPVFSYYRERIVRNDARCRFQGRVHEAIPLFGERLCLDIPIRHAKEKQGDGERNLRIYQRMEEKGEPFNARSLYYYGRELLTHHQEKKAVRILKQFLKSPEGWVENKIDATRQMAYAWYGLGKEDKALQALFMGFYYDVPRGETCCDLGRHFLDRGRYVLAAYWYERALTAPKNREAGAFIQEACYGFLPAISLCICYDRLGDWEKARDYNDLAGKFCPESSHYLKNREYFRQKEREAARQKKES